MPELATPISRLEAVRAELLSSPLAWTSLIELLGRVSGVDSELRPCLDNGVVPVHPTLETTAYGLYVVTEIAPDWLKKSSELPEPRILRWEMGVPALSPVDVVDLEAAVILALKRDTEAFNAHALYKRVKLRHGLPCGSVLAA